MEVANPEFVPHGRGRPDDTSSNLFRGAVAEHVNTSRDIIVEHLRSALISIASSGVAPQSFQENTRCALRKPGKSDGTDPTDHCRTLSLLSHWSKAMKSHWLSHEMNNIRRSVSCKQSGGLQGRHSDRGRDLQQNRESCVLQAKGPLLFFSAVSVANSVSVLV